VHLLLEQKKKRVVITVRDSGVGIATEEQSKIFERFYRVDQARGREMGGAGLGLSIAEWIVGQHRGSIEVQSSPGRGSVFQVELPVAVLPVQSPIPV
jgi:signal transduction histidine kinase